MAILIQLLNHDNGFWLTQSVFSFYLLIPIRVHYFNVSVVHVIYIFNFDLPTSKERRWSFWRGLGLNLVLCITSIHANHSVKGLKELVKMLTDLKYCRKKFSPKFFSAFRRPHSASSCAKWSSPRSPRPRPCPFPDFDRDSNPRKRCRWWWTPDSQQRKHGRGAIRGTVRRGTQFAEKTHICLTRMI